jgi:hypothetical protein
MTERTFPVIREAVAAFPDRAHFRGAVDALLGAGFSRADLSVLASHQPLPAGEPQGEGEGAVVEAEENAAIAGLPYLAPLAIAGIIAVSAGPIAAAAAALVAAGVGGVALKEILDRYSAPPHRAELATAFAGGAALLWVRCADADVELRALRILEECGGRHVHIHGHAEDAPIKTA